MAKKWAINHISISGGRNEIEKKMQPAFFNFWRWVETGKKECVASTKTVGNMEEEYLLVFNSTLDRFPELVLDQNDPSKPSHRLTNGPEPSKTIESDGRKIKNHRKTIDGNGQTAKKHSMVMVSSKTIENLQWSLQNHWNLQWFP